MESAVLSHLQLLLYDNIVHMDVICIQMRKGFFFFLTEMHAHFKEEEVIEKKMNFYLLTVNWSKYVGYIRADAENWLHSM